jgi:23S rRNA pseudouridine1911/1915/1917 synthase
MAVSKSLLAKPAVTHYSRVANGMLDGKPVALLRCKLETGRTHQIRVHLQSIGFPLVGDTVYGKQHLAGVFPRQALHAERLALQHPANRESCEWTAALPADMSQLLARAGIDFTAA